MWTAHALFILWSVSHYSRSETTAANLLATVASRSWSFSYVVCFRNCPAYTTTVVSTFITCRDIRTARYEIETKAHTAIILRFPPFQNPGRSSFIRIKAEIRKKNDKLVSIGITFREVNSIGLITDYLHSQVIQSIQAKKYSDFSRFIWVISPVNSFCRVIWAY